MYPDSLKQLSTDVIITHDVFAIISRKDSNVQNINVEIELSLRLIPGFSILLSPNNPGHCYYKSHSTCCGVYTDPYLVGEASLDKY